jgi:hypothetical protein
LNRRDFVSLVGAGAATAALYAEPVIAAVSGAKIKAIAFDGLAVFDVRPVAALAERVFPGRGEEMSALWRTRQFEYTWLRTVGRQYVDFWEVTVEALVFSCRSLKLELTKPDSDRLMQSMTKQDASTMMMQRYTLASTSQSILGFFRIFTQWRGNESWMLLSGVLGLTQKK